MTFDQLVSDVLALATQRNVTTIMGRGSIVVRENPDFVADLRFELADDDGIWVRPVDADGDWAGPREGFATVREAFEHFDIG